MEPEGDIHDIQERIEELEKLTKANNKILRKLRNHMRMGTIMRVIYWSVIIGSMFVSYYYFQPFIEPIKESYDKLIDFPGKLKDFSLPE